MARAFRFRLETLRRVRQRLEEQHRLRVALCLRKRNDCHERLRCVDEESARGRSQARHLLAGGSVSMVWLQQHRIYMNHLARLRERLVAELAEADRQLGEERRRLVEASRDHKVVRKLRDKHYRAHTYAERRQEAGELDAAGLEVFRRRPADGPRDDLDRSGHQPSAPAVLVHVDQESGWDLP